jgi:hypothetical protein
MTEQEWLRSPEPVGMVTYLRCRRGVARTRAGRRRLRLFGCACCLRVRHLFPGERGWAVVDLAERLADGNTGQAGVDAALRDAEPILHDDEGDRVRQARGNLHEAIRRLCGPAGDAAMACSSVGIALRWLQGPAPETAEWAVQAGLLRDLFGDPFRLPPAVEHGWLVAGGGAVSRLARTIYDDRRFEDMPLLADELEDAGCRDEEVLGHLREPGPHARGCWLLDVLLGRG